MGTRVAGVWMVVALTGCQLEQLFPIEVGEGAARLTVANTGALLRLANSDPLCGFESPAALATLVVDGEPGAIGTATWTIEECVVDLGSEPVPLGTDCNGGTSTASGLVVLGGTRTLTGLVTGNPTTPIVPQSPDAVTISLGADVWGLHVQMGETGPNLLMKQGRIDIEADVHLARSASLGVCSVPTDEITLRRIAVTDAVYVVDDGKGREFKVPVPSADINAQVGSYAGRENAIGGTITVWDDAVDLGTAKPLDPEYSHDTFVSSFSCTEDLKVPVDYTCLSLRPVLADGAAKLTVSTVGNFVSMFSHDTECGLESPAVLASVQLEGEVGREGGKATYTVASPCELDFGTEGRVVSEDCDGNPVTAFGKAAFTGSLAIHGRLTGNADKPVIPSSRHAVDIDLRLDLKNAKITGMTPETMEVVHGVVTGRMHPFLAIDTVSGACSIDLPVVTFEDLTWSAGTEAVIHTEALSLGVQIEGSSLQAQSGERDGVENHLEGTIDIDDERFTIPLEGNPPTLDPSYDRATFLAGATSCIDNLRMPSSDEDCDMHQIIGDGVARLVVQTVGTVAGLINEDANCGFSNTLGVLAAPSAVVGEQGEQGSLTWEIEDCQIGNDALAVYATDCVGNETFLEGHALVDSTRTVFGQREAAVDLWMFGSFGESIIPGDSTSIDLWLQSTELIELSTYSIKAGETEPLGILTIHEGTLDAFVQPATAEAEDGSGYTVATPRAQMSGVRLRNARATLRAQGMTFEITIDDTNIAATNGRVNLAENTIAGTVTVDGDVIEIGGSLDPGYDAETFDDSWTCNPLLAN